MTFDYGSGKFGAINVCVRTSCIKVCLKTRTKIKDVTETLTTVATEEAWNFIVKGEQTKLR